MTASDEVPFADAWNASIARASVAGSLPTRSVVFRPGGRATSPTRTACAPPAGSEPVGERASSADWVVGGILVPSVIRIGAWIGDDISTEAASAARQSWTSTSATALGRNSGVTDGKTARAAAAALAIGSAPATRVVFLVASTGKPSSASACFFSPLGPTTGKVTTVTACVGTFGPVSLPHAATRTPAARASASSNSIRGRGIPDNLMARRQRAVEHGHRVAADEHAIAAQLDAELALAGRGLQRAQRGPAQPLAPVRAERGVRAAGDVILRQPVGGREAARHEVDAG